MSLETIEGYRIRCLDLLDQFLAAAGESRKVRFVDNLSMKGIAATLRVELSSLSLQNERLFPEKIDRLEVFFQAFHESVNGAVEVLGLRQDACYEGLKKAERLLMTALRG